MLNRVVLIGRLAREPELRYTPNGTAVTRLVVAVDRPFTNRQGEREADFIDVVVWQKQAETCANYLGKGRLIAVEGRLQIRSYDDSQGIRRRVAEVVADNVRFLDRPKEASGGEQPSALAEGSLGEDIPFNEDEVPF